MPAHGRSPRRGAGVPACRARARSTRTVERARARRRASGCPSRHVPPGGRAAAGHGVSHPPAGGTSPPGRQARRATSPHTSGRLHVAARGPSRGSPRRTPRTGTDAFPFVRPRAAPRAQPCASPRRLHLPRVQVQTVPGRFSARGLRGSRARSPRLRADRPRPPPARPPVRSRASASTARRNTSLPPSPAPGIGAGASRRRRPTRVRRRCWEPGRRAAATAARVACRTASDSSSHASFRMWNQLRSWVCTTGHCAGPTCVGLLSSRTVLLRPAFGCRRCVVAVVVCDRVAESNRDGLQRRHAPLQ